MTVALILLLAAASLSVAGPRVLSGPAMRGMSATTRLTAWPAAMAAALSFTVVAVALVLWPDHSPPERLADTLLTCMGSIWHAMSPATVPIVAVAAVLLATPLSLHIARLLRRASVSRRRVHHRHRDALRVSDIGPRLDALADDSTGGGHVGLGRAAVAGLLWAIPAITATAAVAITSAAVCAAVF